MIFRSGEKAGLYGLVFAGLFLASVSATRFEKDWVDGENLPGWNKKLPSNIYSGFLPVKNSKKNLHYIFVEAEAPVSPEDAPLVLWLNGGPGCSSLEGLFYEHGPFTVADAHAPPNINFAGDASANSEKSGQLIRNKWSWSRVANVLYLEAPAGVGFSYSTDKSDLKTGDNQTASDNFEALQSFFTKFPKFRKNSFYVSGESYGGVYVPTLSQKIYQSGSFLGNMKGYLIGNGVFDGVDSKPTHIPFMYGHGFISTPDYEHILQVCDPTFKNISKECEVAIGSISEPPDMNGYDAYRTCYQPENEKKTSVHTFNVLELMNLTRLQLGKRLREAVPCINSKLATEYLNRDDVKNALHVTESPNKWQICGGVEYIDDGVYDSMIDVHKSMLKYKPHVLVYNGDVDPGCNYLWGQASARRFGGEVVKKWHPWTYEDELVGEQLGGYAVRMENDVTFTTIHGAGHMSPQWRPEAVYNIFKRFLTHRSL